MKRHCYANNMSYFCSRCERQLKSFYRHSNLCDAQYAFLKWWKFCDCNHYNQYPWMRISATIETHLIFHITKSNASVTVEAMANNNKTPSTRTASLINHSPGISYKSRTQIANDHRHCIDFRINHGWLISPSVSIDDLLQNSISERIIVINICLHFCIWYAHSLKVISSRKQTFGIASRTT